MLNTVYSICDSRQNIHDPEKKRLFSEQLPKLVYITHNKVRAGSLKLIPVAVAPQYSGAGQLVLMRARDIV